MKTETCSPPRVFTDAPTRISFPSYGASEADTPCTIFTAWQTDLQHFPVGAGTLAVRWTRNGQRQFRSGSEQFRVDDRGYLLFNCGREFSSFVESNTLVSCYSVAFGPQLAEDALRALVVPADRLLDEPAPTPGKPVQFFETAYPHDDCVSPLLRRLEAAAELGCEPHAWFEESFRLLAARLLYAHRNIGRLVELLPSARAATRLEIFKRLLVARDFMEANLERPIGITDAAGAACFSAFHFLRTFKQVFGETPHQYLTRRRIEKAQNLLLQSHASITEVCLEVGYESLGSFSTLFKRYTGVSPERYRLENRRVVRHISNRGGLPAETGTVLPISSERFHTRAVVNDVEGSRR